MDIVFEALFFLAIGLLAITITVFVLAVSLLGRAVRMSLEEQEKTEKELKEDNEREMAKIQGELDRARKEGKQLDRKSLEKSLRDLERKDRKHNIRLWWIRLKPRFLKADAGALIPGAFFIISIIVSAMARYHIIQAPTASTYIYLWVSALTMAIGVCFICVILKVIEGVAVTSEETSFVRQKDMFKAALIEFEEAKKPKLEFNFSGAQPPFHLPAESEMVIGFEISVARGKIARNIMIFFYAPPSFDFAGHVRCLPPRAEIISDYIGTEIKMEDMLEGVYRKGQIKIKAPSQPADYTLYYSYFCEGQNAMLGNFNVVVE